MKLELFFREQLLTTNHFSEVVNNAIIGNKAEKREDERNNNKKKKIGSDEMWTTSTAAIIGIISKRLRDWEFGDFCDFWLIGFRYFWKIKCIEIFTWNQFDKLLVKITSAINNHDVIS